MIEYQISDVMNISHNPLTATWKLDADVDYRNIVKTKQVICMQMDGLIIICEPADVRKSAIRLMLRWTGSLQRGYSSCDVCSELIAAYRQITQTDHNEVRMCISCYNEIHSLDIIESDDRSICICADGISIMMHDDGKIYSLQKRLTDA